MDVIVKKPYLHYPVGKEIEISRWLYNQHPEYFEIKEEVKIKKDEHNKRAQSKVASRRGSNRKGN